jgi:predicted acylesterase/phospholipase RssA
MLKIRPKIGLALSSGGARGIVHIGIIEELEKAGIPIDVVCGSSVGAMVAGCYGLGNLKLLEEYLLSLRRRDIVKYLDVSLSRKGFVEGKAIERELQLLTGGKNLEEAAIKIGVVAVDMISGTGRLLQQGSAAEAIRSSMAIPVLFRPVKTQTGMLVDGGLISILPVDECRKMGADYVIGINCAKAQSGIIAQLAKIKINHYNGYKNKLIQLKYLLREKISQQQKVNSLIGWWTGWLKEMPKPVDLGMWELTSLVLDIFGNQLSTVATTKADFLITIQKTAVENTNVFSFFKAKQILGVGRQLGKQAVLEIKKEINQKYGVKQFKFN